MNPVLRTPWVVGVSGASGTPYARSVLNGLLDAREPVDLVVSKAGRLTLLDETGIGFRDNHWESDLATWLGREVVDVRHWAAGDFAAGPSSGSYPTRGMIVVPATTAAVAGMALGLSKDLLQRAATVTIKERRPLVVVPRETPFARSTLVHLLALHDAGAVIMPASPGFYAAQQTVQQLVDFVAAKVLDVVGVKHDLITRWTGELGAGQGELMDDVDRQLLVALRAQGRSTFAELARQVGLSAPAVHERVGKLEASGVITGYHAAVAPEALGYAVNALIGIFIGDSADTDQVAASLAALPQVEDCWFVAGEETFIAKVCVPDIGGLEEVIRDLNAVDGIARTRTTVVLSTKFEDRVQP